MWCKESIDLLGFRGYCLLFSLLMFHLVIKTEFLDHFFLSFLCIFFSFSNLCVDNVQLKLKCPVTVCVRSMFKCNKGAEVTELFSKAVPYK